MSNHNEAPDRIDYQETPDVTEVHAAVQREKPEPSAEVTPMPMWLTIVCAIAVAWAAFYFGAFNGGMSGNVYNEYESSPAVLFPIAQKAGGAGAAPEKPKSLAEQGKEVFATTCVGCHQGTGMGVPGQFPPLVKSEYVINGDKRLVAILLKGITGSLTVEGKQYGTAVMPPWEAQLSSKKIAAVASYIRSEWGNSAPEVSEAKVNAAKKEFASQSGSWTEAQLAQMPADANLPDEGGAAPAPNAAPAAPGAAPAAAAAPAPAGAAPAPATAAAAGAFDLKASIERGKAVYATTCITCHQPTGLGVPGAFPPLVGTEYSQGDVRRMVAMTIKGVNPPLKVKGATGPEMTYMVPMPPLPLQFPILADDGKLADVINYVRNSFGNKDDKGVTPEEVGAIRKEFTSHAAPWTEAELKNFPAPAK